MEDGGTGSARGVPGRRPPCWRSWRHGAGAAAAGSPAQRARQARYDAGVADALCDLLADPAAGVTGVRVVGSPSLAGALAGAAAARGLLPR